MTIRNVSAGNGINWFGEAFALVRRNPGPFAIMGLIVAVIASVPVLGGLALVVFGPALAGGIVYAAREQANLRTVEPMQLFRAFQQPGKLGPMVLLCLPGAAAALLIVMLLVMFVGTALLSAGIAAATESDATAAIGIGGSGILFALLVFVTCLAAWALTLFAVPRVMLQDAEPFEAMRDSFRASTANAGAFIAFALVVWLVGFLIVVLIGGLSMALANLLATTLLTPLIAVGSYRAWRDVYGETALLEPAAVPPAPPVEPTDPEPPRE